MLRTSINVPWVVVSIDHGGCKEKEDELTVRSDLRLHLTFVPQSRACVGAGIHAVDDNSNPLGILYTFKIILDLKECLLPDWSSFFHG